MTKGEEINRRIRRWMGDQEPQFGFGAEDLPEPPDYLSDLNAIHKAELRLENNSALLLAYIDHLRVILKRVYWHCHLSVAENHKALGWYMINAAPLYRAEALAEVLDEAG